MGNTGDLKQFLIKPAQFHSPSSSSKTSSGKALKRQLQLEQGETNG